MHVAPAHADRRSGSASAAEPPREGSSVRALGVSSPAARGGHAKRLRPGAGELALARLRRTGDPAERDALVERYLPLAYSVAARYGHTREPLDDLRQVAVLGLLKAIDRFDPSRGFAFTSFAVPTILGEVRRYLRDHVSAIRLPRDLQELGPRIAAAADELGPTLGRAPTVGELAAHLDVTEEEILDAYRGMAASRPASLDAPIASSERGTSLGDLVGVEDEGLAGAENAAVAARYLAHLSPRDRRVLRLYFDADLTQSEIGAITGVSQMQVSRVIRRSLERLRAIARAEAEQPSAA
jgi:RNA polymerase sigma-B factor